MWWNVQIKCCRAATLPFFRAFCVLHPGCLVVESIVCAGSSTDIVCLATVWYVCLRMDCMCVFKTKLASTWCGSPNYLHCACRHSCLFLTGHSTDTVHNGEIPGMCMKACTVSSQSTLFLSSSCVRPPLWKPCFIKINLFSLLCRFLISRPLETCVSVSFESNLNLFITWRCTNQLMYMALWSR